MSDERKPYLLNEEQAATCRSALHHSLDGDVAGAVPNPYFAREPTRTRAREAITALMNGGRGAVVAGADAVIVLQALAFMHGYYCVEEKSEILDAIERVERLIRTGDPAAAAEARRS